MLPVLDFLFRAFLGFIILWSDFGHPNFFEEFWAFKFFFSRNFGFPNFLRNLRLPEFFLKNFEFLNFWRNLGFLIFFFEEFWGFPDFFFF